MYSVRALSGAGAAVIAASAWLAYPVRAQWYQQTNLTPDGYWHNRYHMLLSMAAYGNYNKTCPETFTQESMIKNFPNSTRPPWTVISEFGPTASGCAGFTAIIPEMNKALIIFRGDYALERSIPDDVVSWDDVGLAAAQPCGDCTVNRFAIQGYLECKEETNNFEAIREVYYGQSLVFSITGHGLGGMHSQIAAVDLYSENIDYYNHAYGNPRVFNKAGAVYYNQRFNGEAGERGTYNNDQMGEIIPEGKNYVHAGTPFYYHGWNRTGDQPFWTVCWLEDDFVTLNTTDCDPRVWVDTADTTALEDHYFYMANVGECTQSQEADTRTIDRFAANASASGEIPTLDALVALESLGQSMASEIVSSMSSASAAAHSTSTPSPSSGPASPTGQNNEQKPSGATRLVGTSSLGLAVAVLAAYVL